MPTMILKTQEINHKSMHLSEATKRKISIANSGTNHGMFGKHHSEEAKNKISKALKERNKGKGNPRYGAKVTAETRKKMSDSHKKIQLPHAFKKGHSTWNKGKSHHAIIGKQHPRWNGEVDRYGHTSEFKRKRREIRKRDKYTCQDCGVHQKQLKKSLDVHHIDGNKKNDKDSNLISLCQRCHTKAHWRGLK